MTGLTSNIDAVIERFKALADNAPNVDVSPALLAGVNAGAAQMRNRVFNEGRDTNGDSLGKYTGRKKRFRPQSPLSSTFKKKLSNSRIVGPENQSGDEFAFSEYEIIRLAQGRQVRFKDLEVTGSLRRSIVPINDQDQSAVISKTKVVCAIPNDAMYKIARYQEEQIGRIRGSEKAVIFTPSANERQLIRDTTKGILKQIYDRFFNSQSSL